MRLGQGRMVAVTAVALGASMLAVPVASASDLNMASHKLELRAVPGRTASGVVTMTSARSSGPINGMRATVSGSAFTVETVSCPDPLEFRSSCSFRVTFTAPSRAGTSTGKLKLSEGSSALDEIDLVGIASTDSGGGSTTNCKVPKLSGLTLTVAKAKLKRAGCRVGRITKPAGRTPSRFKLVVKATNPKAGATVARCTAVKITLKRVLKRKASARKAQAQAWSAFPDTVDLSANAGETSSSGFFISNGGPADLQNLSIAESPPSDRFTESGNCAATLVAYTQCGVQVTYHAGNAAATDEMSLVITSDSDPGVTKRVKVTGTTTGGGSGGTDGSCK